jgi:RNA polymerase primary sigma factor
MNTILQEQVTSPNTRWSGPARLTTPLVRLGATRRSRTPTAPKETSFGEWTYKNEPAPAESPRGDVFQRYIREIGQVKLLTRDEEIALADRIKHGDEEAREQMIKANLRLVVKIARDYEGLGLPLLDLISEGNIGLMKGVERFRPIKGAKLSTYASWWIKQSIRRALANQSKTIRLPINVTDKVAHIRKAELRLRETLNREATDEEVANDLNLHPRRVRQYRDACRAPVCLDSPIGAEDPTPISEIVADENAASPSDELLEDDDNDLVHEILASLDPRESKILAMRFGLEDGTSKTLEEIGEHFSVSRERIRQLQEQALEEMRESIEKRNRCQSRLHAA